MPTVLREVQSVSFRYDNALAYFEAVKAAYLRAKLQPSDIDAFLSIFDGLEADDAPERSFLGDIEIAFSFSRLIRSAAPNTTDTRLLSVVNLLSTCGTARRNFDLSMQLRTSMQSAAPSKAKGKGKARAVEAEKTPQVRSHRQRMYGY